MSARLLDLETPLTGTHDSPRRYEPVVMCAIDDRAAADARGRRLRVITVEGPDTVRSRKDTFVDSYLNFHVVNGAVLTAQFGDRAKDAAARAALAAAYPGREVVQLDVDRLMSGGGGIHCSTMQEPLP
ncbi:agmatine deiminase family protein [Longispora urticae]